MKMIATAWNKLYVDHTRAFKTVFVTVWMDPRTILFLTDFLN